MKAKPKKIATYPNNTFRHFVSSTGRRLGTESKTFCTLASYGGRDRNHKDIPLSIVWICCLTVLFSLISVPTFALEYSSSAGVNFTISPSISVSVSGDLIIDELAPGSSNDSNVINVTVLSNNSTGYTLSSTTGSSTNNYTDLKLDGNSSDNTNKFTNLNTNKASLSNFDNNTWGYSYSIDSGTNWISGNTGSTANGYNGLPIYSSTGIKLVDTTAIGTNTIKFKI
ncbi:hypothetical protein IKG05_00525, partial [Candidatus Saccharibacteria bacterium]|nr:hypothetical protein [Candidatus Saccharibacteria bacterium]